MIGSFTSFDIEFSGDNGITWSNLQQGTDGTIRTFSWNISESPSTECLIKVKGNYAGGIIQDISDAVFEIHQAINPPTPFSLIAPNANVLTTLTPAFSWNASFDPDGTDITYELWLATNEGFVNKMVFPDIAETSYIPGYNLQDNTKYYWKVKATDGNGQVTWSNEQNWYFIINLGNNPPGVFALVSPENGSSVINLVPILDWNTSTDIDPGDEVTYTLYLSKNNSFTLDLIEIQDILVSEYTFSIPLEQGTSYYWKVKAVDNQGAVTWCFANYWVFNTFNAYPMLSADQTSLNFEEVIVNNCEVISYQLTGFNLSEVVSITAPDGFSISTQENSGFMNSMVVEPSNGVIDQTIYVRFCPEVVQDYTGEILNVSWGIETQIVELTGSGVEQPSTFSINIPAGWSGISSYLVPIEPEFDNVMAPINNELIVAKNFTEVYWPAYAVNTIGNFEVFEGYIVKLNSAATLQINGFKPENTTIDLMAGWNILPVISEYEVGYQDLTTQLGDNLIVVTEIAGNKVYWPEAGIFSLSQLIPGKAYMIKVADDCSFSYYYLTIDPTEINIPSSAGTKDISIFSNTSWSIASNAEWMSADPASGSNDDVINLIYSENPSINIRSGQLSISPVSGGQNEIVFVEQEGALPSLSVNPPTQTVNSPEGSDRKSVV